MSKSRAGRKSKRRVHRGPKPKAEVPPKVRDDFADHVAAQLRDRNVDGAKAATISALKLSLCHGRNQAMLTGRPPILCGCGAVARPDGTLECRGMPSDEWFERLLAGDVQREADDARRGDAAPLR
jgi:hypothetical protein